MKLNKTLEREHTVEEKQQFLPLLSFQWHIKIKTFFSQEQKTNVYSVEGNGIDESKFSLIGMSWCELLPGSSSEIMCFIEMCFFFSSLRVDAISVFSL